MQRVFSKFVSHVVPGVVKPLHTLWNEIIGFLFLCFTILAGAYVFRAVRTFDGTVQGLFRIVLPGLFTLGMAYFCVSSFFRARKISRS